MKFTTLRPMSLLSIMLIIILLSLNSAATLNRRKKLQRRKKEPITLTILGLISVSCTSIGAVCGGVKYYNQKKIIKMNEAFIKDIHILKTFFKEAKNKTCVRMHNPVAFNAKILANLRFVSNGLKVVENVQTTEVDLDDVLDKIDSLSSQSAENNQISKEKEIKNLIISELIETMNKAELDVERFLEDDIQLRHQICDNQDIENELIETQKKSFNEIDSIAKELEASNNFIQLFTNPTEYRETWIEQANKFAPEKVDDINEEIKKNPVWWRITKGIVNIAYIGAKVGHFGADIVNDTMTHVAEGAKYGIDGFEIVRNTDFSKKINEAKGNIQDGKIKLAINTLGIVAQSGEFISGLKQITKVGEPILAFANSVRKMVSGISSLIKSYKQLNKTEHNISKQFDKKTEMVEGNLVLFSFHSFAACKTALINYDLSKEIIEKGLELIGNELKHKESKLIKAGNKLKICENNVYFCAAYFGKEYAIHHFGNGKQNALYDYKFKRYSQDQKCEIDVDNGIQGTDDTQTCTDYYFPTSSPPNSKANSKRNKDLLNQIESNHNKSMLENHKTFSKKTNHVYLKGFCDVLQNPNGFFDDIDKKQIKKMLYEYNSKEHNIYLNQTNNFVELDELFKPREIENRHYKLSILDAILIVYDRVIDPELVEYAYLKGKTQTELKAIIDYIKGNESLSKKLSNGILSTVFGRNIQTIKPKYDKIARFEFRKADSSTNNGILGIDNDKSKYCLFSLISTPSDGKMAKNITLYENDLNAFILSFESRILNHKQYHYSKRGEYYHLSEHLNKKLFKHKSGKLHIQQTYEQDLKNCPYIFESVEGVLDELDSNKGYSFEYINFSDSIPLGFLEATEVTSTNESKEIGFEPKIYVLVYFEGLKENKETEVLNLYRSTTKRFRHLGYFPLRGITGKKIDSFKLYSNDSKNKEHIGNLEVEVYVKPKKDKDSKDIEAVCNKYLN